MAEPNGNPPVDPNGSAVPVASTAAAASPPLSVAAEPAAPAPAVTSTPAAAAVSSSTDAGTLTIDTPSMLEGVGAKPAAKPTEAAPPVADKPVDAAPAVAKPPEGEKPAAEAKPAEPAKPADDKPAEAKPADAKPAEAKPAEAAPEVKPAEPPAPVEYKFTWPESIKPIDEKVTAFTGLLNEGHVSPELAQKMVDLHADAMTAFAKQTSENQHRVFNEMRKDWNTKVLSDEVLGGAGHETAMMAVARARDALVPAELMAPRQWPDGTPRISEMEEFLRITGAGDHPVFMRILHNAARFVDEAPFTPTDIRPSPTNGQRPKGNLYTHPSSSKMNT